LILGQFWINFLKYFPNVTESFAKNAQCFQIVLCWKNCQQIKNIILIKNLVEIIKQKKYL